MQAEVLRDVLTEKRKSAAWAVKRIGGSQLFQIQCGHGRSAKVPESDPEVGGWAERRDCKDLRKKPMRNFIGPARKNGRLHGGTMAG